MKDCRRGSVVPTQGRHHLDQFIEQAGTLVLASHPRICCAAIAAAV